MWTHFPLEFNHSSLHTARQTQLPQPQHDHIKNVTTFFNTKSGSEGKRFVSQLFLVNPAMRQLAFWWFSVVSSQYFCCQHSWGYSYCPYYTFASLSYGSQTSRLLDGSPSPSSKWEEEKSSDIFPRTALHVWFSTATCVQFTSVQFSRSVVSNSLRPHGLQHTRPPCPSPTSGVYPNSCPLSQWCHPTMSSSVVPFSSHLQSFPASGSFPMSQFFAAGGHNIGVSASSSVLPMNTQDWSPLGWTGWISLLSKGLSRVFSNINDSNSMDRVLWVPIGFRTYYPKIWPSGILNILNWRNLRKGMYRKDFLPFPRSRS